METKIDEVSSSAAGPGNKKITTNVASDEKEHKNSLQISNTTTGGKVTLAEDWITVRNDLEKIWAPITKWERKEFDIEQQINNCRDAKSRWVFRQTPPVRRFFKAGKVLGSPGQYGVCREAVGTRGEFQGKKVAIKTISKYKYRTGKLAKIFYDDLRNEVRLMRMSSSTNHPNIIKVYVVFEDIRDLHIVMQHCSGGELFDRLSSDGVGSKNFSEKEASKVVRQIILPVYHIHKLGIAHCDLKPENFLFESNKRGAMLKLIDFGMAKIIQWRKYSKRMNGTPYYIAPEVLRGQYNKSCDMWSIGVLIFIIVFGFPPFFDKQNNRSRQKANEAIYGSIKRGFKPKVADGWGPWFPKTQPVSRECKDLISRLLRTPIADRLTSEEALEHPWIAGKAARGKLTAPNSAIKKSVKLFQRNSQLQSEILSVLSGCNYLSFSQVATVEEAFKAMDKDGDGLITAAELYHSLHKIDPDITKDDCETIMLSVDANSNGVMDFDELLSSRINRKLTSSEERMRKLFKCLDRDGSNTLTADEIKEAVISIDSGISLEKCKQLIAEADTNKDGVIDYEEWLKIFL